MNYVIERKGIVKLTVLYFKYVLTVRCYTMILAGFEDAHEFW